MKYIATRDRAPALDPRTTPVLLAGFTPAGLAAATFVLPANGAAASLIA